MTLHGFILRNALRNKRRLLFLASAVQISLGVLDLIGIALIGLVAAVAVSGRGATANSDTSAPWAAMRCASSRCADG